MWQFKVFDERSEAATSGILHGLPKSAVKPPGLVMGR